MTLFLINQQNKALLRTASRVSIEDYLTQIPDIRRSTEWIQLTNRYRVECTKLYDADITASPSTVDHQALTEYVSESAPTHVIDGWSYLGRAIEATLRGDTYAAIHFGYYSELRATMGLLASEGIGIFNGRHPIVKKRGITVRFPRTGSARTHGIVWPILSYWSSLQRAADLLDDIISPRSLSLSQWLNGTGSPVPVRAVAQRWLKTWGIDLAAVDFDHDSRNLSSYRPSEFRKPAALDVHEIVSFVEELWKLFEPEAAQRFPILERILLRSARRKRSLAPATVHELESLGFSASEAEDWATFLADPNDPIPLQEANKQSPIDDPRCHIQILSRAALLLFVATSSVRRLLANAAYTQTDLSFWWRSVGLERGLWDSGGSPADPLDLWADILVALTDSSEWRANNPSGSVSLRDWRRADMPERDYLGAFELVGIWGLLP
jgi:hypothetical protein